MIMMSSWVKGQDRTSSLETVDFEALLLREKKILQVGQFQ